MIPRSCRIAIATASVLVPRTMRADWKREWRAELWHKAASGAPQGELLRCACGAFRDALWFRSSECSAAERGDYSFFAKPLGLELALLAAAVLLCVLTGVFGAPKIPYANASRLVRFQRGIGVLGALDPFFKVELLGEARKSESLEDIATYRWLRGPTIGLRVSRNFFAVLGVKPVTGRAFQPDDPDQVALLTYSFWQKRL